MKTAITINEIKQLRSEWLSSGETVALVPTMGALHEGHLSLVKRAQELADRVVVSIFVNPTQFGPSEDFALYPRTLKQDIEILTKHRVDAVFAPTANEMYPKGYQTWISNDLISQDLCGLSRPGFFRGVCTVVMKLTGIVNPQFILLGKKDYQQYQIISRMMSDLNIGVNIVGGELVREEDGLAMSSRNRYLSEEERKVAVHISEGLFEAKDSYDGGHHYADDLLKHFIEKLSSFDAIEVEYAELRTVDGLKKVEEKIVEPSVLLVAAKIGKTRLIDNIELGV